MPSHNVYDPKIEYILERDVEKFRKWFAERGGVVRWVSQALELMGRSWTGPLRNADGTPAERPHWSCNPTPDAVFTDPAGFFVAIEEPVRDFKPTTQKNVNSRLSKIGLGSRVDYEASKYMRFVRGVPLSEYAPTTEVR